MNILRFSQTLLLLMVTFANVNSQNLVPNPSFETILSCSNLMAGIQNLNAPPWNSPQDSPDLYNICSLTWNFSVPTNQFGYQYPRTGNGYAGAGFYEASADYREFLHVKLDNPLVANQNYCMSFYISLSSPQYVACNNMGMYISPTEISNPLNLVPQIKETSIINDTANWALIQGEYEANGGEQYIIIGNFSPLQTIDTLHFAESIVDASYYYIDDVDIHIGQCNFLQVENFMTPNFNIYPNPSNGSFTIETTENDYKVTFTNVLGENICQSEIKNQKSEINLSEQPNGLYFINLKTEKGTSVQKLIIQK